jgi:hypothetical protein
MQSWHYKLCEPRLDELGDYRREERVPRHRVFQQRVEQRYLRPLPRAQALPRVKHLHKQVTKKGLCCALQRLKSACVQA